MSDFERLPATARTDRFLFAVLVQVNSTNVLVHVSDIHNDLGVFLRAILVRVATTDSLLVERVIVRSRLFDLVKHVRSPQVGLVNLQALRWSHLALILA